MADSRSGLNNDDRICLMAHLVAGYPTMEGSFETARGLVHGGARYLEVQFPYSDPTADGPAIQEACKKSLEKGFTVDAGFSLVRRIVNELQKPLFVMSYGGMVFARGVGLFVAECASAGAVGVIVPDLPPGYDEGLYDAGEVNGVAVVPVVAPSVSAARIHEILALKSPFLYAAIRVGITGNRSKLDRGVIEFLTGLRQPGTTLMAGFGITAHEQAAELQRYADVSIVGSELVRTVSEADKTGVPVYPAIRRKAAEIIGGTDFLEKEKTPDRRRNTGSGGENP